MYGDDDGYTTDIDRSSRRTEHSVRLPVHAPIEASFSMTPVLARYRDIEEPSVVERPQRIARGAVAIRAKAQQSILRSKYPMPNRERPKMSTIVQLAVLAAAFLFVGVYLTVSTTVKHSAVDLDTPVVAPPRHGKHLSRAQLRQNRFSRSRAQMHRTAVATVKTRAPDMDIGGEENPADIGPVDVVYTWVNSSDPQWRADIERHDVHRLDYISSNRYRDWNELRFSMRSVRVFAPWIRHIYLVLAYPSQIPNWLNTSDSQIRIVFHRELFDNPSVELPTFNSLAIESVLHRISSLSNYFLYFNNDVLLTQPISLSSFIRPNMYYKYNDWDLSDIKPASECYFTSETSWDDIVARIPRCQHDHDLYYNRVVALKAWSVTLTAWFAHMPHLWERRVLFKVERRLAAFLERTRANRFRDPLSDVSMHVQYEGFRKMMSDAKAHDERRVVEVPTKWLKRQGKRAYMFETFNNENRLPFYFKLHCALQQQPQFFGIDDDLKQRDEATLRAHSQWLDTLFATHWPHTAPWELSSAPINVHNHSWIHDECPVSSASRLSKLILFISLVFTLLIV